MKDELLDKVISSKKTCYFVSPHFDDAVLSAGALAGYLKDQGNKVVVINIFTQAGPRPYTLSAKAYLRQCQYVNAERLYEDRHREDHNALASIADQVINLGFTDALWRPKHSGLSRHFGKALPELGVVYPTYRLHITKGKLARSDRPTVTEIMRKLESVIESEDPAVFCPLGIGNHIDHVITRMVCDELFSNPIHWADYPYNLSNGDKAKATEMKSFSFDQGQAEKGLLIEKYKSQYKALFPDTPQLMAEVFYYE
jgi:LmbE family N-acetylglucosaminyl deacetylase